MPEHEHPRPDLYTQDYRCLFVGSQLCNPDPKLTHLNHEHLVPSIVGRDHPSLFRASPGRVSATKPRVQVSKWAYEIINSDENIAILHRACHDRIDNGPAGKLTLYRTYGVPGLLLFIGTYPRAVDRSLQDLQYHQWGQLFHEILDNLRVQDMRNVKSHLRSAYALSEHLIEMFLYKWSRGDFFDPGALIEDRQFRQEVTHMRALGLEKDPSKSPGLALLRGIS